MSSNWISAGFGARQKRVMEGKLADFERPLAPAEPKNEPSATRTVR